MNPLFFAQDVHVRASLSDILELLSAALSSPNRSLAAALKDNSYFADLSACLQELSASIDPDQFSNALRQGEQTAQDLASLDEESLYHRINREYTRLFISPRHELIPPYEGLYVHRDDKKASLFINPSCMHAEQEYGKHAFPFPEKGKIPGDHMAIELRFLAFLISEHISAEITVDSVRHAALSHVMTDFASKHLNRWYAPFMRELEGVASEPLYSLIACAALCILPLLTA